MKNVWKIIDGNEDRDTSVMAVPGGVVIRYRYLGGLSGYAGGSIPSVNLVFVPGAKIEDFEKLP